MCLVLTAGQQLIKFIFTSNEQIHILNLALKNKQNAKNYKKYQKKLIYLKKLIKKILKHNVTLRTIVCIVQS